MKDSIALMQIYRGYLELTGDLVSLLENHLEKSKNNNLSKNLKEKYKEFRKHSYNLTERLNADLHKLIKIDYELKNLEELENEKNQKN